MEVLKYLIISINHLLIRLYTYIRFNLEIPFSFIACIFENNHCPNIFIRENFKLTIKMAIVCRFNSSEMSLYTDYIKFRKGIRPLLTCIHLYQVSSRNWGS